MATKTVTHISDDLDGSTDGVETVTFALHGTRYEIDLSKDHQSQLKSALTPFLDKARKAAPTGTGTRRARSSAPRTSRPAASEGATEARAIRAWAADNSVDLPARGRIPTTVVKQYRASQGNRDAADDSTSTPAPAAAAWLASSGQDDAGGVAPSTAVQFSGATPPAGVSPLRSDG